MKNTAVILLMMFVGLNSCGKEAGQSGIVRIDAVDSLLYVNDEPAGHLGLISGEFQFTLPELSYKLDSLDALWRRQEDTSGMEFDRKCLLTMRDEQPFIDLMKIVNASFQRNFPYVQLVPRNQLTSSDLTICLPERPVGLTHHIYLTAKGIWIAVPFDLCHWGTMDMPKGKKRYATSLVRTIGLVPNVAAKFIPLQDGRHDWNRLEAELELITNQLGKIHYTFGRHFKLYAESDIPCGDLRKTGRIIQKTIPKPDVRVIHQASLVDISLPAFRGRIPLGDKNSIGADSFSVNIGMITDTSLQENVFNVVDTTRFSLLGLENLLIAAIWHGDHELMKSVIGFEPDILNGYPALHYPDNGDWRGFTPLMLAVDRNDTGVARILLDLGADIKKPSRTYKGQPPMIDLFDTKAKAPVEKGKILTPLQLATEKQNQSMQMFLKVRMKK